MEKTNVQRLAGVLVMLICNVVCLLLSPGLASLLVSGELGETVRYLVQGAAEGYGLHNLGHVFMAVLICWKYAWMNPASAALTVAFWVVGAIAAWIFWQKQKNKKWDGMFQEKERV